MMSDLHHLPPQSTSSTWKITCKACTELKEDFAW